MTAVQATQVTGTVQRESWLAGAVPPVEEVRAGIWSLPVVFPDSPLRYTLCYLIEDGDGPVLIDPGLPAEPTRLSLIAAMDQAGYRLSDVAGIVITHAHFDHHGLTAAVRDESGAWVGMHRAEAESIEGFAGTARHESIERAWLQRAAVPPSVAAELHLDARAVALVSAAARATVSFADGDRLPLADQEITVVHTPGHTVGHACLHHQEEQLLFSGDHVLPKISPHISQQPNGTTRALARYLESLRKVRMFDGAEVLPGHEWRFTGLADRVDQLLAHHEHRCAEIIDLLRATPGSTAWDLTTRLTWSRGWPAITGWMRRTALAESLAHLEYLQECGRVAESIDRADGTVHYFAAG